MNNKKKLIEITFVDDNEMKEVLILNRIPEQQEWDWCYGSILYIKTKKDIYELVYIENTEYGLVFYNKRNGSILIYEELESIKENIEEVKIIIPSPDKLVKNYLKGLTIQTLYSTDEIKLNERKLFFYKETIKFLSELVKDLDINKNK